MLHHLVCVMACVIRAAAAESCDAPTATTSLAPELLAQLSSDLAPFNRSGVTPAMVRRAYCLGGMAMRVQIIDGRLYVAGETASFQSRALSVKMMLYTLLQRVARNGHNGNKLPDVDFVVSLHDFPPMATFSRTSFSNDAGGSAAEPPPHYAMFGMTRTAQHRGVVLFPDHTFWNWREARTAGWDRTRRVLLDDDASGAAAACRDGSPTPRSPYEHEHEHEPACATPATDVRRALFAGAPTSPLREAVRAVADAEAHSNRTLDIRVHEQDPARFVSLERHCDRRVLLHLPGITYSARLKYVLLCGSAVVAPGLAGVHQHLPQAQSQSQSQLQSEWYFGGSQQSGRWFEFWYRLLVPNEHYIDSELVAARPLQALSPYLVNTSSTGRDNNNGNIAHADGTRRVYSGMAQRLVRVLRALDLEEAEKGVTSVRARVGRSGRELLRRELHMGTVWAYWEALLRRYAALQRFAPQRLAEAIPIEDSLVARVPPDRVRCASAASASATAAPTGPGAISRGDDDDNEFE